MRAGLAFMYGGWWLSVTSVLDKGDVGVRADVSPPSSSCRRTQNFNVDRNLVSTGVLPAHALSVSVTSVPPSSFASERRRGRQNFLTLCSHRVFGGHTVETENSPQTITRICRTMLNGSWGTKELTRKG